ncbi:MAG: undecaprenyl-diphosphate phosphatase [Planctomycetota bacterium]
MLSAPVHGLGALALAAASRLQEAGIDPAAAVDAPPSTLGVFALAVVQGLTEFLPVSSSGHLALGRAALGLREGGLALDVALHVGTLFAIAVAFRRDVLRLFQDLARGRLSMWVWLVVATVPVGAVGLLFKDTIESAGSGTRGAASGLFVTAAALLVGEGFRKRRERAPAPDGEPTIVDAIAMGCAQAVAIWPGVSRSGSTISAGLARGKSAHEAARLSFLMSLPAISGAAVVELPDALEEGFGGIAPGVVLGAAVVAGLVGFAALKTLLIVLRKGSFPWFAAYCAALGTAALVIG